VPDSKASHDGETQPRTEAAQDEEPDVDIHAPHAAKSWREFLIEIGTIVTGILIALALEQSVEWLHERRIAGEAREAVRAEVRENFWWINARASAEPCIARRLHEIDALLTSAERGQSFAIPQRLGLVPHIKLTKLRWEANSQAGRTSLFSGEEQRLLTNFYFSTDQFLQYQTREEDAWSGLRALQGEAHLTPEAIHDFRKLLAEAKYFDWRIQFLIHRGHQWSSALSLTPENPGLIDTQDGASLWGSLCAPIDQKPAAVGNGKLIAGFAQPEDLP